MSLEPLVDKQLVAHQHCHHRINIYEGSVRSSKTVCSLIEWVDYVTHAPPGPLAMIGKTERTLRINAIEPLIEMFGPTRIAPKWGEGSVSIFGRQVHLVGANDERSAEKIRGRTLRGAYVDEITILPESFWAMLLTRLSLPDSRLIGTTNPDNPRHWLLVDERGDPAWLSMPVVWVRQDGSVKTDDSEQAKALDVARFSFNLDDNPTLPPDYVASLKASFSGLWYRRFIGGEWVQAAGAIYDMFDPDRHVISELPECERWAVAIDYGTSNPLHALLLGRTHDRIVVLSELRHASREGEARKADVQYADMLEDWLDGFDDAVVERVFVDPSAASFITQLRNSGWSYLRTADNRVLPGIQAVSSLLASGRLAIHESCTELIGEMVGYVWDKKAAARGDEKPVKVADHGVDALRYGVMGCRRWWRDWLAVAPSDEADE